MYATFTPLPVTGTPFPSRTSCAWGVAGFENAVLVTCRAFGSSVLHNELAAFDETDAGGLAPIAALLGTLAW